MIHEKIGRPECPDFERWIQPVGPLTFRVHKWLQDDDRRAYHDHPYWFITLVVRGGYDDISPSGTDRLVRWSLRFRRADWRHTVQSHVPGTVTVLLSGPKSRSWGFWPLSKPGKFVKANKWFLEWGSHPCYDPQ